MAAVETVDFTLGFCMFDAAPIDGKDTLQVGGMSMNAWTAFVYCRSSIKQAGRMFVFVSFVTCLFIFALTERKTVLHFMCRELHILHTEDDQFL